MTIVPRNGRFGVHVYDPTTKGKRWVGTFDTERHAKRAELDAQDTKSSGTTVKSFAADWLGLFPRPSESTEIHHMERIGSFVTRHGSLLLEQITPHTARSWAVEHPSTVQSLKTMFNDAKKAGLIEESPFAGVRTRKSRGRRDLEGLTEGWIDALVAAAEATHGDYGRRVFGPAIEFNAYTGLRAGEMYALRFSDVDVENRIVNVTRAFNQKTNSMDLPKSRQARSVYLTDRALAAFERIPQVGERIFVTGGGKPMDGRHIHYWWHPVRCAAGRPDFAWHGLRHFFGTWLANNGVGPIQIAKMMGHQDGGTLAMRLYIHVTEQDARAQVAAALGERVTSLRSVRG